jgi:hypothetical protein
VATELHCRFAMATRRSEHVSPDATVPAVAARFSWRHQVSRARTHFVAPRRLFAALDGRELLVSGRRWRIEVFSVRDLAGLRWIQLALKGKSRQTFALKLDAGAGVRRVVEAVTTQLSSPAQLGDMSNVA